MVDYQARLETLLGGEEFISLTANPTYLSLQILKQLGIDIAKNIMRREAFEQLGLEDAVEEKLKTEDIDQDKLKEIIIREQEKLKKLFAGPPILLRLQQKLINALLTLYNLIGLGLTTPEEIHRLIIKIAALHREIEVTTAQIERDQRLYAEQEQKRELQIETEFLERSAEEEKSKEETDTISDVIKEGGASVSEILSEDAIDQNAQEVTLIETTVISNEKISENPHHTPIVSTPVELQPPIEETNHPISVPLEFILKKKNSLSNFPYNNTTVPLQFEAKVDTISNRFHLIETKSKDGHLFTFKDQDNPNHVYEVNFKIDGVHFSTQSADSESLYILEQIIHALDRAVETLELETDWKINAKDMTTGFKALTVLTHCGATLDNLAEMNLQEAIPVKPSEIAKNQKEMKQHAKSRPASQTVLPPESVSVEDPAKPRNN